MSIPQHTRIIIGFVALLLITTSAVRSWEQTPWGISAPDPAGQVRYGSLSNPSDTLCYLAFAEQSAQGQLLFENLYTTEPQRPALFNLFFMLAGKIARLTGTSASFAYSLLGTIGACVAVVATLRCAQILGLAAFGQACVGALLLWSAGLSWLHYAVPEVHGFKLPMGTDLSFMDLVPSLSFQVYPLHSFAFGATASLLMLILLAERRLRQNDTIHTTIVPWLAFVAFLIGLTRPYEPIALTFVYLCYCSGMALTEGSRCLRPRLPILVAIALGFAPGLLYNMWVAHQPVWSNFARDAASLTIPKVSSLIGFGILWAPAFIGIAITWNQRPSSWRLLSIWMLFAMLLMLAFNTGRIKLAGGSFLALALLNARALEFVWQRSTHTSSLRLTCLRSVVTVFFALGFPTLPVFLATARAEIPEVDSELLALIKEIRHSSNSASPAVLAPAEVGAVFAGLGGFHTYAGHWSLTPNFRSKVLRLDELGFESLAPSEADTGQRLEALLRDSHTDFVVVKSAAPVLPYLSRSPSLRPLVSLSRWSCFKVQAAPDDFKAAPPAK